jgi:hypothetical protein
MQLILAVVAEFVSLAKQRPRLEGVFGPLTEDADASLRGIFARVDDTLMSIASHFGTSRAGHEGTGLKLVLLPSGQLFISGDVGTSDGHGKVVEFMVELRPSWVHGVRSGELGWDVEATIDADCQHTNDHGGMDTVFSGRVAHTNDPEESARSLLDAAAQLLQLATTRPVSSWLDRARDMPQTGGREPIPPATA